MDVERDFYGVPIHAADRMQDAMLGFFDFGDELEEAGFPAELRAEYEQLRLRFIDEFERQHPGYGKGRAIWR